MKYWLMKSEPETWSWQMQVQKGAEGEPWSGVRNHQAKNNMKDMKLGDLAFFYHSGKAKEIVGIVKVCKEYELDPTDPKGIFGQVWVQYESTLSRPVTLQQIKNTPTLKEMALLKQSRLSVMPLTQSEWEEIILLSTK